MDKNGSGERSKFVVKGDKLTLLGGSKRDEESDSRAAVGAGAGANDDIHF